uniref:AB hydrolase-1 domain-containing protein n=1 Tax=Phaeomonas parva TaxID=124430 RepID=A0A7S1UKW3_9STRA|mmetsp:Transcript_9616/g.28243  ORF Transcript_9616/g.28243 Transcript_9616/m.28243 type:complete len:640 (+) Transcript_9616:192-2111(+)
MERAPRTRSPQRRSLHARLTEKDRAAVMGPDHDAAGGHVPNVREGYDSLVEAVIRPRRAVYQVSDLGPKLQRLRYRTAHGFGSRAPKYYMRRDDFSLLNKRGLLIRCSLWTPIDKTTQAAAAEGADWAGGGGSVGSFLSSFMSSRRRGSKNPRNSNAEAKSMSPIDDGEEIVEPTPKSPPLGALRWSGADPGDGTVGLGSPKGERPDLRKGLSSSDSLSETPRQLTEDGEAQRKRIQERLTELENEDGLPVVVFLHGNASSRVEAIKSNIFNTVASLGACVCAFDFAGCGHSQGEYVSLGVRESEDVHVVVEFLTRQGQFKPAKRQGGGATEAKAGEAAAGSSAAGGARCRNVVLWGRSMGSVAAILYASRYAPNHRLAGLILDSPFTSFPKLIEDLGKLKVTPYMPNFVTRTALWFFAKTITRRTNRDTGAVAGNFGTKSSGRSGASSTPEAGLDQDLVDEGVDLMNNLDPLSEAREARLDIPTLILAAHDDTTVPPDHAAAFAEVLRATAPVALATFPGTHNSPRPAGCYSAAGVLLRALLAPTGEAPSGTLDWTNLPWPLPKFEELPASRSARPHDVLVAFEAMMDLVPKFFDVELDVSVPAYLREAAGSVAEATDEEHKHEAALHRAEAALAKRM